MADAVQREIQRREWTIEDGIVVPYYVDEGHQELMEGLLPHEQFTMRFPFDTAVRGLLMPFAVLCKNVGYVGLDQDGYNFLGSFLKENIDSPDRLFIGSTQLDAFFGRGRQGEIPLLMTRRFEDKKVYFPAGYYVVGNR